MMLNLESEEQSRNILIIYYKKFILDILCKSYSDKKVCW